MAVMLWESNRSYKMKTILKFLQVEGHRQLQACLRKKNYLKCPVQFFGIKNTVMQ